MTEQEQVARRDALSFIVTLITSKSVTVDNEAGITIAAERLYKFLIGENAS